MKINTTRFGELSVNKKDVINFTEGPLGFEQLKKFFIVDPGDKTLILWLQSCEDGGVAFPIIEPKIFRPDYIVKLLPAELNSLKLENLNNAGVYTILTIPQDVTEMSSNLKAPLIINNQEKIARQIVLQDNKLNVRYPMYADLKRHIVNYTSDDSKRTHVELNKSEENIVQENSTAETSIDLPIDEETNRDREI